MSRRRPGPAVRPLVVRNAGPTPAIHSAARRAASRLIRFSVGEHADHVFVIGLPRYSPELNPVEGLWGYPDVAADAIAVERWAARWARS